MFGASNSRLCRPIAGVIQRNSKIIFTSSRKFHPETSSAHLVSDSLISDSAKSGSDWLTPTVPGTIPKEDAKTSQGTVLLFPGQGAEFVGMGRRLNSRKAKDLFEQASAILGYDSLKLCTEGPSEVLRRTENSQVAVFIASLAALEELKELEPEVVEECVAAAGLSSGEFAALVFGGCISFEKGVELIQKRGEMMQKNSEMTTSGLMSIYLRFDSNLSEAMEAARKASGMDGAVCRIANHLFTQFKVIGGHEVCLQFLKENSWKYRLGPMKRLKVSGAFHTEIMYPAAAQLRDLLKNMEIRPPNLRVYSNVTGLPHPGDPHKIKNLLFKHMYQTVRWEQCLHKIYSRGPDVPYPRTIHLGPGSQIEMILKRTNGKAGKNSRCIVV